MAKFVSVALVSMAFAWPSVTAAAPVPCDSLIAGHIAWMSSSQNHRRIGAKFSRVKITSAAEAPSSTKWGHVSFAEGAFGWRGTEMGGRFMVAFNDRGFDSAKRDITDITLNANGTGYALLRSWGDAKLIFTELRCDSSGFLTAIEREGNGASLITLSLRRETF